MNRQSQWLFEAPITFGANLSKISDYYSNSQWESEWELPENSDVGFPQSEEEWEVAAGKFPGFSPSEVKALRITSTFETGHSLGFGGLTGNFDRMGVSFGLMQWNIGSGSLQPLLWEFAQKYSQRFDVVFGSDAIRLRNLLQQFRQKTQDKNERKRIMEEQMRFAISINHPNCDPNKKSTYKFCKLVEPWASYFRRLEMDSAFQKIQIQQVRKSMNIAINQARQFGLKTERGLALMFDIVTQAGGAWLIKKSRAKSIEQSRTLLQQKQGRSLTEREVLTIVTNVLADTSSSIWREDVRTRKMTIVNGYGVVHRRKFDLAKDFGLSDLPWEPLAKSQPEFLFENEITGFVPVAIENPGGKRIENKRDPDDKDIVSVRGLEREIPLHRLAANAWQAMVIEAKAAGIQAPLLLPVSGYRSSKRQSQLWKTALLKYGSAEKARQWVAPPGSSAHHSGRAIDLWLGFSVSSKNVKKMRATPVYKWLVKNAVRFGFYPYPKEPWHWEYNPPV
jgi:D-alanyl-D-alanine carboxypeptidase